MVTRLSAMTPDLSRKRFAVLGNSGSGKSTLASALAAFHGAACLDLDTIAWVPGTIAVPRDSVEAESDVRRFCSEHASFVIEGCYENLIAASFSFRPHLVYLDVDASVCERHCRARPFESHKYSSPEEQDQRLAFLLDWVRAYYTRTGPMSRSEHIRLYESYAGPKSRHTLAVRVSGMGEVVAGPDA